MQDVNILFSAVNRRYICVCYIATAADFSIQVQMNQSKIVWLSVGIKFDLLLEVVLYLVRVSITKFQVLLVNTRPNAPSVTTYMLYTYKKCDSGLLHLNINNSS